MDGPDDLYARQKTAYAMWGDNDMAREIGFHISTEIERHRKARTRLARNLCGHGHRLLTPLNMHKGPRRPGHRGVYLFGTWA